MHLGKMLTLWPWHLKVAPATTSICNSVIESRHQSGPSPSMFICNLRIPHSAGDPIKTTNRLTTNVVKTQLRYRFFRKRKMTPQKRFSKMIFLNAKNSESSLLAEPQGAVMFSCRTLTFSAKVSCRTLHWFLPPFWASLPLCHRVSCYVYTWYVWQCSSAASTAWLGARAIAAQPRNNRPRHSWVSRRTLEIAEPEALNLEKDNLAEPWNAGSFRVCPILVPGKWGRPRRGSSKGIKQLFFFCQILYIQFKIRLKSGQSLKLRLVRTVCNGAGPI